MKGEILMYEFDSIELREIRTTEDLEELISHTISEKEGPFTVKGIVKEVKECENFNNFVVGTMLFDMVESKVHSLRKQKKLTRISEGRYFVVRN